LGQGMCAAAAAAGFAAAAVAKAAGMPKMGLVSAQVGRGWGWQGVEGGGVCIKHHGL
jgi:hypothetical protein